MAAPNIVGPDRSDDDDPAHLDYSNAATHPGRHSTQGTGAGDPGRAELVALLAARLAAIESRDRGGARQRPGPVPRGSSIPGASSGPLTGPPSPPIGSSGSTGRRRVEPGGHPEDAPGDPEAVAKAICLRLLTASARPRAALVTALRQRGIPDQVADTVLDRFVEVGLIDDRAYAEAFVAAKHRDRALGVTALRAELRRKGLDEGIVDAAVQTLDQDAERERARALISRRVDSAMNSGAPAARRRLVGLLARRGYSADLARQVVDEALADYGAGGADWLD